MAFYDENNEVFAAVKTTVKNSLVPIDRFVLDESLLTTKKVIGSINFISSLSNKFKFNAKVSNTFVLQEPFPVITVIGTNINLFGHTKSKPTQEWF